MQKEGVIFFAQRQPQVPPRPIILVQRRPDLLQTAQRRGACLYSLVFTVFRSVFYQTAFCSFAVNKDYNNLHNHHPSSCRELAAALTRTPPAAKIKRTAVHMVGLLKYVFSWGEKHCPPPIIGLLGRFRCKTTMLSSKSPDHHVRSGISGPPAVAVHGVAPAAGLQYFPYGQNM